MTNIVGQEKPELQHYGVKGMKWGVTKKGADTAASTNGSISKPAKKKYSSQDINSARIRTNSRVSQLQVQADRLNTAKPGSAAQKREAKNFQSMQMEYLKNPDRATALRMTTGEKVVAGIFAGPVGAATLGGSTVGVAIGVGARVATRKSFEKDIARRNG